MKVVILAGGKGARLRPLTEKIPKPMVKVGGMPILEHTLLMLPRVISDVILVIGHNGELIRRRFGDSCGGRGLSYVVQNEPLGTAHALGCARGALQEGSFLLLSGDDLYHPEDLSALAQSKDPAVLVIDSPTPERFGVCSLSKRGYIEAIVEKPKNPQSNLVNIGAYLLNNEIFSIQQTPAANGEYYLAEQVGKLALKRPVAAIRARSWFPVNNHEELAAAENFLAHRVAQ